MDSRHVVLIVGATGRTGGRVVTQLLGRGVAVRALVRSTARLPGRVTAHPLFTVSEVDVLSLTSDALKPYLAGCDTVISCLGHRVSVRGIFAPPFSIVTRSVSNLTAAVHAMQPAKPVRVILMSSVSVHHPRRREPAHGAGQRLALWTLRMLLPPARDNQRAADFLVSRIGPDHPYVEWVVVRPDTLREGDVSAYRVHDQLVGSIFHPDATNMANVARFMCELACDDDTWTRWRGQMPVIVNVRATPQRGGERAPR